jgi:PAS domain S-box-containing protein
LTGWKREEVVGADWFLKFIPETDEKIKKLFFDAIGSGAIPAHYENPVKTRSGELREIVWNNTMLRDSAEKPSGPRALGRMSPNASAQRKRCTESSPR